MFIVSLFAALLAPEDVSAEDDARILIVGTKVAPPFAIEHEDGSWSGISIDLWRVVAADLGLQFEFRKMDLSGLFEGLETGELDAAVAAITVTSSREARIDFSHPYYQSGLTVVLPRDGGGGTFGWLSGVFTPGFLKSVLGLVMILMIAGAAVWLFERRRNPAHFGGSVANGLASAFWWSAVTMTTVGYGDKAPLTAGGRVVALIWMFTAVVVTSGLTAAITSSLTVDRLQSRVDDLRDLKNDAIAVVGDSTSAIYLKTHGHRIESFATLDQALDSVSRGEFVAMVHDAPIIQHALMSNPKRYQGLEVLSMSFESQSYAIGLVPGSALREGINRALLKRISEDRWERTLQSYLGN
jgi:ABC-type amino acid transport substrate-binding protein